MRWLIVACITASSVGTARADFAGNFATYVNTDRTSVREVTGYRLPEGMGYADLIVGSYTDKAQPELVYTRAMLERCTSKQCTATFVSLPMNEKVEVLGLIDLAGAPVPFPDQPIWARGETTIRLDKHMAHPALVIRHSESKTATGTTYTMRSISGTESHATITILSLERAEPVVFSLAVHDHYPGGVGQDTTLRLERGSTKGALAIVATEQRHIDDELACIPPKPTETRYHLDGARYVATASLDSHGCH